MFNRFGAQDGRMPQESLPAESKKNISLHIDWILQNFYETNPKFPSFRPIQKQCTLSEPPTGGDGRH